MTRPEATSRAAKRFLVAATLSVTLIAHAEVLFGKPIDSVSRIAVTSPDGRWTVSVGPDAANIPTLTE